MTKEDHAPFTHIVESWLDSPDDFLDPDTVLDRVMEQVDTRPQRRARWPEWRIPFMNKFVTVGLGAAAVVVLLFVGAQLLGSPSGGLGGAPSLTPEASVAVPTDTPEPSVAEPSSAPEGELPQGPFLFVNPLGGPQITVTIPAPDWSGDRNGGLIVKSGDTAALFGPFFGEFYVYGDPCQWSSTIPATPAATVDEFVAAMTDQASRDASAPVDITVDGYAGKSITVHVPDDAEYEGEAFTECDEGQFASWAGGGDPVSDGPSRYHQGPGQTDELWILDVEGELIVVDAIYDAETPTEDLDELHAILESMTFDQ